MFRTTRVLSCCLAAACCQIVWGESNLFELDIVATLYVDDDAPPGGDGLSWATAYSTLHEALDAAPALLPAPQGVQAVQIRIGAGVYVPEVRVDPNDPRTATFQIGGTILELAGGYAGYGAPDPDARDKDLYETVLSGDIKGDDEPNFINRADNTYHVLAQVSPAGQKLSYLIIRGGNAVGVPNYHPSFGYSSGGGIIFGGASLIGCLITECEAEQGGGMGAYKFQDVGSSIRDCVFLNNRAELNGGAIGSDLRSGIDLGVGSSRFLGNSASIGGAIYAGREFVFGVRVLGCEFSGNRADGDSIALTMGGAVFIAKIASPSNSLFTQCTFANNSAPTGQGGGVATAFSGGIGFTNCAFAGNTDLLGSGLDAQAAGTRITFRSCFIQDLDFDSPYFFRNPTAFNAPMVTGDPLFADPLGPDGVAGTLDDDLRPAAGSPLIDAGSSSAVAVPDGNFLITVPTIGGELRVVDNPASPNVVDPAVPFYLGPIDIGAYEYQRDDDNDATLDSVQIAADPSLDCDGNGILDDFELFSDCDNDGTNDRCQLAANRSLDLNQNGVLDACDIALGTSEDQNSNGIPDENEPALRFVDASREIGTGVEDGRSWATAYTSLDDALDDAGARLAPTEIWVVGGVYTPTGFGEGRSRAFHVRGDTTLLGGFIGDEVSADERDPSANPTILSGDFNQDDPTGGTNEENALHVVIGPRFGEHATLDGFIIERGNADQYDASLMVSLFSNVPGYWPDAAGAGVLSMAGDLTMRRCIVRHNSARLGGAAIHVGPSSYWDGANVGYSTLSMTDSVLHDNEFDFVDGLLVTGSSGVFASGRTHADIDRSVLIGNLGGSALLSRQVAFLSGTMFTAPRSLDVGNTLLIANDATLSSGATVPLASISGGSRYTNTTIAFNNGRGVGVSAGGLLANSILWGNTGDTGTVESDQIDIHASGEVRNSIIQGWTGTLPGTHASVLGADPMFLDPVGPDMLAGTGDEDLRLSPGSPAIDASDNNAIPLEILSDLDGLARFVNDCDTPDTGIADGLRPLADLGAYEFQARSIMGDASGDGFVDVTDINLVLSSWMTPVETPGLQGDVSRNGFVDMDDLNLVLGGWGGVCE